MPPGLWALSTIALAVLLANGLFLLGLFDPNPLGLRSGLVDAITPGVIRGQPTIDPNAGFISQAVGHRAVLDLLHGQLPWWNPYEGTGMPLAAGMQPAAFFPPTLLTWFANGQIYEHVLLELTAGFSTYFLLRKLSLGRVAATAGGVAFALNGTFAWFTHATVNPVPFLPLLLLGLELARARSLEDRHGGWWLIAVAGALSVYAGFPEVAYLDALLAVVWFAARCGGMAAAEIRRWAVKALLAAAVGALLSAPLLIAMAGYFGDADLWLHTGGYFSHAHLPSGTLPQQLMPYVFGPPYAFSDPKLTLDVAWVNVGGFLCGTLLILALLGLCARGRRALSITLTAWIAVMVARMYGTPSFVGDAVNLLPGLANAAVFRYSPPSVALAATVLAAIGLDGLLAGRYPRRTMAVAGAAALVIAAGAVALATRMTSRLTPDFIHQPYLGGSVAWVVVTLAAVLAAGFLRHPRLRIILAAGALLADAMLLFALPELAAPRGVQIDTAPVAYLQRHLGLGRFFTLGPLAPNYGSYYGLASLNAVDVPVPRRFASFVTARLDPVVDPTALVGNLGGNRPVNAPTPEEELLLHLDGYREAGVAYVLAPNRQALPSLRGALTPVTHSPTTTIYRLSGASPYFTAPGCSVQASTRTSVRLTCAGAARLTRRETYMRGWTAEVDGRARPLGVADGVFQAVPVPAGTHEVSFSYSPPHLVWGWLGLAGGLAALAFAAVRRQAQRSRPSIPSNRRLRSSPPV